MFNLDELDLDFNDDMFDILPKKLKSDTDISDKHGRLSFGIENAAIDKSPIQSFTQSSYASPPNILSHLNNNKNIQECKKYFSQAAPIVDPVTQFSQSPSYSPITSTQKPSDQITNCLFDKTNVISPIRMKPGILSEFRKVSRHKTLNQTTKSRKFPGPAGCLPNIGHNDDLSKVTLGALEIRNEEIQLGSLSRRNSDPYEEFNTSSELSDSDTMKTVKAAIGTECWPIFENYCLGNVFNLITKPNGLPNFKIPVTCLVLFEIEYLPRDAAATMTDSTGSIKAALHRLVLQQYRDKIKSGSVFILKKVSVFSPSGKKYFLNITLANVVAIYGPGQCEDEISQQVMLTRNEVDGIIKECATKHEYDISVATVADVGSRNQGPIDFFDDAMDDELASMLDESFPS